MRRLMRSIALVLSLGVAGPLWAADLNTNSDGVMISGFDPVSYFTVGEPQQGSAAFSASYDGANYWFVSEGNMNMFLDDPERFTPQYGGYCSYGVSIGQKFDVDPTAWSIQNGRLFLQLDPGTRVVWQEDEMENVRIADAVWPSLSETSSEDS